MWAGCPRAVNNLYHCPWTSACHPESCSTSPSWPWLGCPVTMEIRARKTDSLMVLGFTFNFKNGQIILSTYCVLGKHRDGEIPAAVLPESLESVRIWDGRSHGKQR